MTFPRDVRPGPAAAVVTAVLLVPALLAPPAFATPGPGTPAPATGAHALQRLTDAELPPPELRERPRVQGDVRYGSTVRATRGSWRGGSHIDERRYRWIRDGEPIPGRRAGRQRYTLQPADVGRRITVRVRVRITGQPWVEASSRGRRVAHRTGVRRRVTYSVETRGRIVTDPVVFRRQVQQTFDDPRGWRGHGIQFRRVARGGSVTLVLAEASTVPTFSSGCSATWSCRVGRYVVINQARWRSASPAWNAGRRTVRDYRHMVVNHETGHWLGRGHASCGGPGRPAPVMMQQSKGRGACRFNPWPLRWE